VVLLSHLTGITDGNEGCIGVGGEQKTTIEEKPATHNGKGCEPDALESKRLSLTTREGAAHKTPIRVKKKTERKSQKVKRFKKAQHLQKGLELGLRTVQ